MLQKKSTTILMLGLATSFISLAGCSSTHQSESTGQYVDSAVVTSKVKSRLLADNVVSALPITVKTYKNTVLLSGFVNNETQKYRAINIARETPGVINVQDALVIKRNHSR